VLSQNLARSTDMVPFVHGSLIQPGALKSIGSLWIVGALPCIGSLARAEVPRSIISLCLDHTIKSDDQGAVSPVTGRHYDQDPRIGEKREALQRLADEIRRTVDSPVEAESVDLEQRLAA
jgi:hypothetical protein